MEAKGHGPIDNWLRHIRDIYHHSSDRFRQVVDDEQRVNLLCERNVLQQRANVCHTNIVQAAWERGQPLSVHGWIYSVKDGSGVYRRPVADPKRLQSPESGMRAVSPDQLRAPRDDWLCFSGSELHSHL